MPFIFTSDLDLSRLGSLRSHGDLFSYLRILVNLFLFYYHFKLFWGGGVGGGGRERRDLS